MTSQRRRQITDIVRRALAREVASREAFVDEACSGDPELRAEVEAMLIGNREAGPSGPRPSLTDADEGEPSSGHPAMALPAGVRLGPYEIVAAIGAGGMGEVYKACDRRLDRIVAIKVLPGHLARSADRRKRFDREARLISQLSHPHICALYDVGNQDGLEFIVMEFVVGETLAQRLARRPMTVSEALPLFAQIAEALEAAHAKGVVHRDLKPANVQITPDDEVKVLDFGVAKAIATAFDDSDGRVRPTMTQDESQLGVIVGTPAYMSPEQARGQTVDPRTDIWALGCCLFSALAGRPAFGGRTPTDTLAAVLEREPAWEALPPDVPPFVESLLRACLQKDPERRPREMADVRLAIEDRLADSATLAARGRLPALRPRWRAATWVAGLLLLAALGLAGRRVLRGGAGVPRLRNPTQVSTAASLEDYPTWSPDGRTVAYESNESGNWDIWVSPVGGGRAVNRTGDHGGDDRYPSWSPDGRYIAFWSAREGGGYFVAPALGGPPRKLGGTSGTSEFHANPAWSADSTEVAFVNVEPAGAGPRLVPVLERVSLATSESRRIPLEGTQESRLDLSWSADGRFLAYVDSAQQVAETSQLFVLRFSDGVSVPLTDPRYNVRSPRWSPDGEFVYFVSNRVGAADVWRQGVAAAGTPHGEPEQVTAGLEVRHLALSADGKRLAYSKGRWVANIWRVPILEDRPATWADAQQMTFDQAFIEFVDVSPDGGRLAYSSDRSGNQDLWIMPMGGGEAVQLTTDPAPEWAPRWSHDGTRIGFYSFRSGDRDLWSIPAAGGPAKQLTFARGLDGVGEWSPDDREIAFRSERSGNSDIWIIPAEGGEGRVVVEHPAGDYSPTWSPDGQWLAYFSNRAGRLQIWRVRAKGGEPELLTRGPGVSPRWSIDGTRIFFVGVAERARNLWAYVLDGGREYPVTQLIGRRGDLGYQRPTADGKYLYFTWRDDPGDIWAMDLAPE